MTIDRPDAADLLATARAALLEELLPALPAEKHYAARMIANAISIALREASAPGLAPRGALERLAGVGLTNASELDVARALAHRIRAGDFDRDAGDRAALHRALLEWTAARVAIWNPKALER